MATSPAQSAEQTRAGAGAEGPNACYWHKADIGRAGNPSTGRRRSRHFIRLRDLDLPPDFAAFFDLRPTGRSFTITRPARS